MPIVSVLNGQATSLQSLSEKLKEQSKLCKQQLAKNPTKEQELQFAIEAAMVLNEAQRIRKVFVSSFLCCCCFHLNSVHFPALPKQVQHAT